MKYGILIETKGNMMGCFDKDMDMPVIPLAICDMENFGRLNEIGKIEKVEADIAGMTKLMAGEIYDVPVTCEVLISVMAETKEEAIDKALKKLGKNLEYGIYTIEDKKAVRTLVARKGEDNETFGEAEETETEVKTEQSEKEEKLAKMRSAWSKFKR